MSENKKETLGFQTEVKQMLHLMVHSLYSNREIFLRELVSNASDAIDKLRFAAIDNPSLLANDPHPSIRVGVDEQKQEITVSDDGIGMTRAEVIEHLGTVLENFLPAYPVIRRKTLSLSDNLVSAFTLHLLLPTR